MGAGLRTTVVALAITLGLTACGGGVGGDGAAAPAASPAPTSSIPAGTTPSGAEASELADAIRSLPPASSTPTTLPASPAPVSLALAELGVGPAPVVPVGILPNGELEVPGATEVGWYRYGAQPGRPGTSVMAAHIAYDGVDGVFARLAEIEPGDTVDVTLDDGRVINYVITDLTTYNKKALPFDDIFGPGTEPRLVLISCGGSFDPVARSYDSNVVAYAVPA